MKLDIIAKIKTDFPDKFGLPRQSGIVPELKGTIIFEPEYRNPDSLRGIEGFSHLWIIWGFSHGFASTEDNNKRRWSPTVRPPRLGGNIRQGVFATRSPNRPNPLGLSCVKIEGTEDTDLYGTVIHVSGIDMTDMTPIYDIKPYLPHADCIPDASGGFASHVNGKKLTAVIPNTFVSCIPDDKLNALIAVLEEDPRPSYHDDQEREYGFSFAGFDVLFKVDGETAYVTGISKK